MNPELVGHSIRLEALCYVLALPITLVICYGVYKLWQRLYATAD